MAQHDAVAHALAARLRELRAHVAKLDEDLQRKLPADSEDQAQELENREALEAIARTERSEISQIEAALDRIADGTYGTCTKCGDPIAQKRLAALPTAVTCIRCAG